MKKFNRVFNILLVYVSLCVVSCSSQSMDKKKSNDNWIMNFNIILSPGPNPASVVFKIHLDNTLRDILLSKKWDSIKFTGGVFDSLYFNDKIIGLAETNSNEELILGMSSGRFSSYKQSQVDSIALDTFSKAEIKVFLNKKTWQMKSSRK